MIHRPLEILRRPVRLVADPKRLIARPFIPGGEERTRAVLDRALSLTEEQVSRVYSRVLKDFSSRHKNITATFEKHFAHVSNYLPGRNGISDRRRLLIGAYFTSEYSLESVALFNPSIVPHPDQSGLEEGACRFIMSLRACGEGHISSIEFRTGIINADHDITFDPVAPFAAIEKPVANKLYDKHTYFLKLIEMGAYNRVVGAILDGLEDEFTLADLELTVDVHRAMSEDTEAFTGTAENLLWLARSNYHLEFPASSEISERVIFPVTENESRGVEDARFALFTHEDGTQVYYATYTAYNGFRSLPQFIETTNFIYFKIITLNGRCAQHKGMALFPRKINGQYAMISRLDGESLSFLTSDNIHFWNESKLLQKPTHPWEFMQIGNCGSPIETDHGWLLLTHGVGPMRQYCIGMTLLDLEDPSQVIAQAREPILIPHEDERDGYVPNVVYSCGAMVHGGELILPYALSDTAVSIATGSLDELFSILLPKRSKSRRTAVPTDIIGE